ncbi:MAG: hypothetical protein A2359_00320 [Candidatus Moranbacteria bacterium RIFOXYB1_FULL_43_19]|nr:MAG: hypothetical protein A2359_00320 [Candidatus Moranbacteria bacterium RIFOXYB1_FULL_43_19]OGI33748.1 MAG: hypothetical protein A2420_04955 [Candidatus Moranbacteria bacterium RIFOXYC1_FULL_44_13]
MRKFILYFLLVFLFASVVTFSYGFLNGEKIRSFATEVSAIQARHSISQKIEKIEASFRDSGKKDISQIREESVQFSAELDGIIKEAEAAEKEIGNLGAPESAAETKKQAQEYYSKLSQEASDLKGVIDYMSQIIDVAAVFGEMKENASLDELKNLIAQAKEKGSAVETDVLPPGLESSAQNLKDSMNVFLVKMEDMAMLKLENAAELDASYSDFSQKEDEFFSGAKKYIDGMEDLGIAESRIKIDLERLSNIKFSLK